MGRVKREAKTYELCGINQKEFQKKMAHFYNTSLDNMKPGQDPVFTLINDMNKIFEPEEIQFIAGTLMFENIKQVLINNPESLAVFYNSIEEEE